MGLHGSKERQHTTPIGLLTLVENRLDTFLELTLVRCTGVELRKRRVSVGFRGRAHPTTSTTWHSQHRCQASRDDKAGWSGPKTVKHKSILVGREAGTGRTSRATIRSARPSATAVFPTPGSPIKTGLFLLLLERMRMQRRISLSLPMTGSSLPSSASAVRSRAYCKAGTARVRRQWGQWA